MKFIIQLSPLKSLKSKEGTESVLLSRFHNGFTPIIGPIEEDKLEKVIEYLKTEEGNEGILLLVFDGIIY